MNWNCLLQSLCGFFSCKHPWLLIRSMNTESMAGLEGEGQIQYEHPKSATLLPTSPHMAVMQQYHCSIHWIPWGSLDLRRTPCSKGTLTQTQRWSQIYGNRSCVEFGFKNIVDNKPTLFMNLIHTHLRPISSHFTFPVSTLPLPDLAWYCCISPSPHTVLLEPAFYPWSWGSICDGHTNQGIPDFQWTQAMHSGVFMFVTVMHT